MRTFAAVILVAVFGALCVGGSCGLTISESDCKDICGERGVCNFTGNVCTCCEMSCGDGGHD